MMRVVRRLFGSVCLLLLTSAMASAQAGASAQISGIVKDTSGGVLPGADVVATQTETGFKRNTLTDATGAYTIPSLPIGPYKLEVNLQGFKTYSRTGIVLRVNDNPVINVDLSLGAVEETVLVQAESPLIETRNMGVGQVMDNKRILELPLNGRNPADLVQYLPAVVPQPQLNATSRSFGGTQGGLAFSIAGGQSYGVAYLLDGATHNNPYDNLNLPLPFPDALQEFKVETSALTAQNGMHSGAAVNAVTKSGTNRIHGDVFEFLRHHSVNATNPFNAKNLDGTRKDDGLKRNQYVSCRATTARSSRARRCSTAISTRSRRRRATPAGRSRCRPRSPATVWIRRCSAKRRWPSRRSCRRPTTPAVSCSTHCRRIPMKRSWSARLTIKWDRSSRTSAAISVRAFSSSRRSSRQAGIC
ncbi:MAG: hypothetical protein AUF76_16455 [Acidobacteria bacterium 13_1_20CM_2_65_9]|nr:MAG: hypothetical protein AUF76_16455 [Acidobacteria bacterium 13_1_20CM_2_65_9]